MRRIAHRAQLLTAASALTASLALLFTSSAGAAIPDFLAKSPEDGLSGIGAGQMREPPGIAADPNLPGNVYVVDSNNHRISVFTPWGEFVRSWGWGVDDGSSEPQVCTAESGCQQGLTGGGAGQFKFPEAIAIDSNGDVYVIEAENHRVQKFDSEGNFILTFGFKVNKTKEAGTEAEANLCTKASGDECQAGSPGTGPGRIGEGFPRYFSGLAISPIDGTVFVNNKQQERIDAFNPDGSFKESIELPESVEGAIAADADGNLYAALVKPGSVREVRKLEPHGPTAEFTGPAITLESFQVIGLAPGAAGNLYVARSGPPQETAVQKVLEFDPTGKCLSCGSDGEGGKEGFDRTLNPERITTLATGSACGPTDVYVGHFAGSGPSLSFINIFGEPPDVEDCPPPKRAPQITSQYALSADTTSAALQARINPNFWPDTRFYVEYGTSPCFEGGCTASPAPPGALLTSKTTKAQLKTAVLNLEGLAPDTTYHYRFVAKSSGGGPVVGLSGKSGAEAEGTFTTYAKPTPESCPANEAFRGGPAALLPDCRAYELVSPLDKNNADIKALPEFTTGLPATLDQSSLDGDRLAYGSATAFGDAPSGAHTSQYVATRGKTGWQSHAITPLREELVIKPSRAFDTEVKALSADLCESWIRTNAEPIFAPAAPPGFANLYRRTDDECGGPSFEALTTVEPQIDPLASAALELQGLSDGGDTAIYVLIDSLAGTEAPPQPAQCLESGEILGASCNQRLYLQEQGEGPPHYVCILPDGMPLADGCAAGTGGTTGAGGVFRGSSLQGAISADGGRVFWTSSSAGLGKIYMRENPAQPQSGLDGEGNCTEPELACTIAVSKVAEELSGPGASRFWAAAADGSKAIFTTTTPATVHPDFPTDLYEFDVDTETTTRIAGEVLGGAGVSKDASRIYLVSKEACGSGGQAGERNLYLYEAGDECAAGEMDLVATLAAPDVLPDPIKGEVSAVAVEPWKRSSRVSPDGLHLAFMSEASLTGHDNTDQASGKADTEVFLYDATANGGAGKLLCASCNPSGARPVGEDTDKGPVTEFWVAAQIPVWQNSLYAARALSDDGSRLYFESVDALTPRDTNGAIDVYQWEAPEAGGCEVSDYDYSTRNEGCVSLISSGKSKRDSRFMDASPDGADVFFATLSGLQPQDYGLIDVYDARVGGGLPPPPIPPPGCEGDSCQSPAQAPNDPTPASASFRGAGDPKQAKPKPRCGKGKRKVRRGGRARCVSKRNAKSKKQRQANRNRRTSR